MDLDLTTEWMFKAPCSFSTAPPQKMPSNSELSRFLVAKIRSYGCLLLTFTWDSGLISYLIYLTKHPPGKNTWCAFSLTSTISIKINTDLVRKKVQCETSTWSRVKLCFHPPQKSAEVSHQRKLQHTPKGQKFTHPHQPPNKRNAFITLLAS